VRIIKVDEGGGFGSKHELYEEALVGWLAQQLGRPVRLQFTRAEEFSAGRSRHAARVNIRLGLRRDGRLLVSDMGVLMDSGAYASHVMSVLRVLYDTVRTTYPAAVSCFTGTAVRTNTLPGGAYRGYGAPQAIFALEQAMDAAASKLGMDALEIRLRNAISPGGKEITPLITCLQRGAHIFGWSGSHKQANGEDEIVRANGVALAGLTSGTFPARLEASAATVRWNEDGTATLITGTCDSSTGSSTVMAQIVAEELAIPITSIDVHEGDTDLGMLDMGSYAQRTITVGGEAARQAAVAAREALLEAVASEHHRSRADLMIREGFIYDRTGWSLSIETFCRLYTAKGGGILATTTYRPLSNAPSFGVCFAQVAVDRRTGKVIVERCVSAADCGRVLNPLGATGQVLGGTVQGSGGTLIDLYHKAPGGTGPRRIRDHGVPGALDAGHIAVVLPDLPDGPGPYGAKGLGEVSIIPVAAAIANAVTRAVGSTPYQLPMRPPVVWRISHEQK
jgi:CO/xanthine dehydrogenase Mo-binding subunit